MASKARFNSSLKASLDRPSLYLEEQLVYIEAKKRHSLHRIDNEIRDLKEFLETLTNHSGMCDSAVPTSEKEAFEIRKKYNIIPKMTFGPENYKKGLTAVAARDNYRNNFSISTIERRARGAKKLSWPGAPVF